MMPKNWEMWVFAHKNMQYFYVCDKDRNSGETQLLLGTSH